MRGRARGSVKERGEGEGERDNQAKKAEWQNERKESRDGVEDGRWRVYTKRKKILGEEIKGKWETKNQLEYQTEP